MPFTVEICLKILLVTKLHLLPERRIFKAALQKKCKKFFLLFKQNNSYFSAIVMII